MATNTPFGQRLGLVLEGGAMRGIYTAGVLDVFLEAGIMPDVVVGVSAGALHGCSYVAGQKGRTPTSGKVMIDGKDIFSMNDRNLTVFRRRNIGFIFQALTALF